MYIFCNFFWCCLTDLEKESLHLTKNFRDISDLEWVNIICKKTEWDKIT